MTDLEITRLCAKAMGLEVMGEFATTHADGREEFHYLDIGANEYIIEYAPLHNDAQCFALVKRLKLGTYYDEQEGKYGCYKFNPEGMGPEAFDADLNRAICECVAKMQAAK